jgi:hypothetical protein
VHKVFVQKQELANAKTLHKGSSLQEWADEELGSAYSTAHNPLHASKQDPLHAYCSLATDDDIVSQ